MASPQCCANPPTLSSASGEGKVVDSFGGIRAYVAGAQDSKAAVVLISDIFGFEAPKLRNIADKVASSGYFVVVPDFLHGDPFVPEDANRPIPVWIKEHPPGKAFDVAKPVIAALKEQGVSSVGAAGYCWGAKVVAELAKANQIQAAVMCHPSVVTVDDIKEVKCPIAVLGAENDKTSPPELIRQFEQVLSSNSESPSPVLLRLSDIGETLAPPPADLLPWPASAAAAGLAAVAVAAAPTPKGGVGRTRGGRAGRRGPSLLAATTTV